MKKFLSIVVPLGLVCLWGCNGVGDKDTVLARINDEKVYVEDETMIMQTSAGAAKFDRSAMIYERLLGKAALVSKALVEFPELNAEWEQYYKDIDIRILTMMYQQFYTMKRMQYSEDELKQFYDSHRDLFPPDSVAKYSQPMAAAEHYVFDHKQDFDSFLAQNLVGNNAPTARDTNYIKSKFVDEHRKELRTKLSEMVTQNPHFTRQRIPSIAPEAYYEAHKDQFMTLPGYELYQIQGTDSSKLARMFKGEVTLDQFKKSAVKFDKNPITAADSGRVGVVKKNYVMPYGIGIIDGIDSLLAGKAPGFVTPVLYSQSDKNYHRFYLAAQVEPVQKSYDRAKGSAEAAAESDESVDVDSSFALISKDSVPVFTMKDFLHFNESFFKAHVSRRTVDYVVNMVYEALVYSDAAKELGLDRSWEYRALVRDTRTNFIVESYLEKKAAAGLTDSVLKELYDRIGSPLHAGFDFERAKQDLRKVASIPENVYKHDYYLGYRTYTDKTYEQAISQIFARRNDEVQSLLRNRYMAEAYAAAAVHIYDSSLEEYKPDMYVDVLLAKADSLRNLGDRTGAYNAYHKIMYTFGENDTLFQKVAFEMAQVENENNEFQDAEADYYAFYTMWPESPNAEKAMFSRGFILDENIKNDTLALKVLEEFQQKYPKSELKESVDWLVDNIKSGGKLADDLMKKISEE